MLYTPSNSCLALQPALLSLAIALVLSPAALAQQPTTEQTEAGTPLPTTAVPEAQLPTVEVKAQAVVEGPTEHSGAYIKASSNTTTKLDLTPRQTPQILHSITHQMMEDFAAENMEDVLNLTPGVSVGHTDDDRRAYTSRGYSMAVQFDGLPSTSGIDGGVVAGPDAALLDNVNVLLGASGLINGAGLPGGVINMNYKRPTKELQAIGKLSFGAWDLSRQVVDLSGPLVESGRLRARMISVAQSEESFRDIEKEKKKVFYGVIEGDLTDSSLLLFSVQKQDIYDNVTDRSGLPEDNNQQDMHWDRSTFLAPAWNYWNKYATTYKLRLEQKLAQDWQLVLQGSMLKSEADWLFGTLSKFDSTTGDATFGRWAQYNEETSDDLELHLRGPFELFGRSHQLVAGGSWTKRIWNGKGSATSNYTTNLYQFDPQTSLPRPELVLDKPITDQLTKQSGSYLSARLSLSDPLHAIIGGRTSWYKYQYQQTERRESGVVTPYAGLTYDLSKQWSAYTSYSDMFNPQSLKDTSGRVLDPEIGANYELGLKGELYSGRLNLSAALFKIEKINEGQRVIADPVVEKDICGGACYIAKGETKTQGFDLSASGELSSALQLAAGFSQYKKDDNHKTVRIAKLQANYLINENWTIGSALDSSTKTYGSWGMAQDARTLVGLFGRYKLNKHLDVALNIDNLLDREYYANSLDSGYGRQY